MGCEVGEFPTACHFCSIQGNYISAIPIAATNTITVAVMNIESDACSSIYTHDITQIVPARNLDSITE
jgi:hypothetical protein